MVLFGYAIVYKKEHTSLNTHRKCGFKILSDTGQDYLHDEKDACDYGLEYCYLDPVPRNSSR